MKKKLMIYFLLHCFILNANAQDLHKERALQVYLCSRLTESAKEWNNEMCKELTELALFRPQDNVLPDGSRGEIDYAAYQADRVGMENADLLLVLPPYGRDCAWEIGWFCGQSKPTIAYIEQEGDWLRDAMVKGGITAMITNNPELYDVLLTDPAIKTKTYLIPSKQALEEQIRKIYHQETQHSISKYKSSKRGN